MGFCVDWFETGHELFHEFLVGLAVGAQGQEISEVVTEEVGLLQRGRGLGGGVQQGGEGLGQGERVRGEAAAQEELEVLGVHIFENDLYIGNCNGNRVNSTNIQDEKYNIPARKVIHIYFLL